MRIPALGLALCASVAAHAADGRDYLDTIVVTASRTPSPLANVTSAISIIDRAEIERRQVTYVADLLRTQPGLAITNNGGIGKKTELRVRGAEGNHVLVLIDGIEANDLSTADEFDFGNLTTDNIERIEIVRGPHSSLWGSEAVAGVINIVTREGGPRFDADMRLEGGSFATNRIAVGAGGSGDRYDLRVAVNRLDTGATNASRVGDEDDAHRQQTIDLKGHLRLTEALRLTGSLRHTSTDSQTDSFDFTTSLPIDTPGTADTKQSYARAGLALNLWDGHWTQELNGRWTSTENKAFDPVGFLDTATSGDKYAFNYQSHWRFDGPLAWVRDQGVTLAVDREAQYYKERGFERRQDVTGYVFEYASRWFDALALSGSVRYDQNSAFRDVVTYRVAGGYDLPWDIARLTLAYATGQKAPLFTERFGFSPSIFFTFIGNPALKPEKSTGWEVSLRRGFTRFDTLLEATYFNERTEDEINGFFSDTPGVFTAINLPGITRRRGVETSVRANLLPTLDVHANYTHVAATDILDGPRLDKVRVPRHQGALGAAWRFLDGRAGLGMDLVLRGRQDDFDFSGFTRTRVALDRRTQLNVHADYALFPRVKLFARVDNLLDDRDEEVLGYVQPGIAGYLGIRLNTAE